MYSVHLFYWKCDRCGRTEQVAANNCTMPKEWERVGGDDLCNECVKQPSRLDEAEQ